jgi:hypothetical protein
MRKILATLLHVVLVQHVGHYKGNVDLSLGQVDLFPIPGVLDEQMRSRLILLPPRTQHA